LLLHRVTDTISRLINTTTVDLLVPLSDYIIQSGSCNTRHSLPFRSVRRSVKCEGMNLKATNYTLIPRSAGPSLPSLIYIPPFRITLDFPPSRGFSSTGNIQPVSLAIKCNNYNTMILHVPGMKNPNTGAILEPEFCMVNHSCLSKSHTKSRLQDPPCVRVLHAGDLYTEYFTSAKKKSPKRVPPPSILPAPANAWGLLNPISMIPNTTNQLRYRCP